MCNELSKTREELRTKLISLLENFETKLIDDNLREKVISLIPVHRALRKLGGSLIADIDQSSATDRILAYLRKYPQRVIEGDELMVVSGISQYARRIRELRMEMGWPILSGKVLNEMVADGDEPEIQELILSAKPRPDSYFLLRDEQDREAAYRWKLANQIRKSNLSVKNKIIKYLRENVGNQVTGEELRYLAKNKSEWARRVRELRTEDGWPVMTRISGKPALPVGVYVLETDRQAPEHDRKIKDLVRVSVLTRDEFRCRLCNWSHHNINPADPRSLLELHHIDYHVKGGQNSKENLITLCNVCHDDVHRGETAAEELFTLING